MFKGASVRDRIEVMPIFLVQSISLLKRGSPDPLTFSSINEKFVGGPGIVYSGVDVPVTLSGEDQTNFLPVTDHNHPI